MFWKTRIIHAFYLSNVSECFVKYLRVSALSISLSSCLSLPRGTGSILIVLKYFLSCRSKIVYTRCGRDTTDTTITSCSRSSETIVSCFGSDTRVTPPASAQSLVNKHCDQLWSQICGHRHHHCLQHWQYYQQSTK